MRLFDEMGVFGNGRVTHDAKKRKSPQILNLSSHPREPGEQSLPHPPGTGDLASSRKSRAKKWSVV
jgi:hypothetical protein